MRSIVYLNLISHFPCDVCLWITNQKQIKSLHKQTRHFYRTGQISPSNGKDLIEIAIIILFSTLKWNVLFVLINKLKHSPQLNM